MNLWLHLHTYIHTYIQVQSRKSTLKELLRTWPQGGIRSRVCHYIWQIHSEPLISCRASLLQSTITTVTQFKQLQTVTEYKYIVDVTGITHEQILTSCTHSIFWPGDLCTITETSGPQAATLQLPTPCAVPTQLHTCYICPDTMCRAPAVTDTLDTYNIPPAN